MPPLDLSKLWEEHTRHEFATRDTAATLATMVEDAYVNHVPVMTGGFGKTPCAISIRATSFPACRPIRR
jgi:carboxymethylenebutenolidase